jgi:pimeloyl-ACP methyl ester carboxylesterase
VQHAGSIVSIPNSPQDALTNSAQRTFRTLTYDRRGHSQSERPASQGSIEEDVADLALLITARTSRRRTSSDTLPAGRSF